MLPIAFPTGLLVGSSSGILAFEISKGITFTGIVVGIISGVASIVAVIYGVRWKIAYEVERKAREGERALNDALEDRVRTIAHERDEVVEKLDRATNAVRESERTIARLEALPNLERVLELMTATFDRIRDRIDELHVENKQTAAEQADRVIAEIRRAAA